MLNIQHIGYNLRKTAIYLSDQSVERMRWLSTTSLPAQPETPFDLAKRVLYHSGVFFWVLFLFLMKVNKGSTLHGKTLSSKLRNLIIKKGRNCPGKLLAFHLSLSCKLAISGSHNKARLGREHSLLPWLRRPSPSGLITRKGDARAQEAGPEQEASALAGV